ncbi:MAG: YybS family protein [Desulfobacterales bacterium]
MLKDIANGVLITCLILSASIIIPFFGIFCSLLIPLPVLYYRIKLGRNISALIPMIALVMMLIVMNTFPFDIVFVAVLLIIGFSLGELLESQVPIEKTMLITGSLVFFVGAFCFIIFSAVSGHDLLDELTRSVAHNREFLLELYRNMGMPAESISDFTRILDEIQNIVIRILPALVITSTFFIIWINLLLGRTLLRSRQMRCPDYGRLNIWQAPDYLVWGVIGCGLLILIPDDMAKTIGLNGLIALMMIYFFQGIAIVSFFFEKKQVPRFAKIMLYALLILQEVLLVVIAIGFIDVWANFRKLEKLKS